MKVVLHLPENVKTVDAREGENLLDLIRDAGVHIDANCNGSGTCGKCKVKLVKGNVEAKGGSHSLNEESKSRGFILSCVSDVKEDIEVEILKESIVNVTTIQVEDRSKEFYDRLYTQSTEFKEKHGFNGHLHQVVIEMDEPTIEDNISDITRIKKFLSRELDNNNIEISLPTMVKIPTLLRENKFHVGIVYILERDIVRVIDIRPKEETALYGISMDIGTTSVSASLVDLSEEKILGEVSCANAQSKYGGDVINRIVYSLKGKGLQRLQQAIVNETINPLIKELCDINKIKRDEIYIFVASANTTMTQLLLGIYADYLRKEPYIPAITQTKNLNIAPNDIGIKINDNAKIVLSPSVASYVGGDITAGVIAAEIAESPKNIIFIDLGTNGEIVFGNEDFLMTCACSAGPAFEGGEITCGMRAAEGAIEAITIEPETFKADLTIIGSEKPYGICGSGIIDLISELKKVDLIDPRGRLIRGKSDRVIEDDYGIGKYIVAGKDEYEINEDVYITEADIDNFMRAKAAVYSATYVLLSSLGLDFDLIDEIKVAGGIGSHINIKNAINIGLFPEIDESKYSFIGNSSLTGSHMSLLNKNTTEFIEEISEGMTYLELSVYPGYMDEFISATFIPHTEIGRFPNHNKL